MADQEVNIRLGASGGDQAANEVRKPNQAFEETKKLHGEMSTKFAEKFEHVGVHMFGHQLLGLIGIHAEARPILGVMSLAVGQVAGAFGVAAGPVGAFVMGLAAAAAIAYKVVESHKTQAEELEKLAKSQETAIQTSTSLIEKIKEYGTAVGNLPPKIAALLKAEEDLNRQQRGDVAGTLAARMRAAEAAQRIDSDRLVHLKEQQKIAAAIAAQGSTGWAQQKNIDEANRLSTEIRKVEGDFKAQGEAIAKARTDLDAYAKSGKTTLDFMKGETEEKKKQKDADDKLIANADKIRAGQVKSVTEHGKAMDEMKKAQLDYFIALDRQRQTSETKWRSYFGLMETNAAQAAAIGTQAFNGFASSIGSATASMIMDGQNFFQSFEEGMKNMTRAFIQAVTEMMIKWLALKAVMGIMGGGMLPGAIGSGNTAAFGPSANFFATGTDRLVDRPTSFVAGESGAERVTVTPLNANTRGGGGGSTTTNISMTLNVSGAQDPQKLAEQVGLAIIRRIRGMGELNYVRAA